jgi:hypothetical protein
MHAKKMLLVLAVLALPLRADQGSPPAGWKEVAGGYKKSAYAVWLPADGKVSDSDESILSKYGQIKVYRTLCQRPDGSLLVVSQIILPPQLTRERPKARQDFFRDMCLQEFNGKLVEEKKANLGTMAGKEYLMETPKGMARYQVFGTGVQIFRVLFVGSKEQLESKDAGTFLTSFKRTQQGASAPATATSPTPKSPPLTAAAGGAVSLKLPAAAGGAVMSMDNSILIVSLPSLGSLYYYDTIAEKELKKVDVDFQPAALARQGLKLFAAAKGAGIVHVLDATTGKELSQIKVPGTAVTGLVCNPRQGRLYAVNASYEVSCIDPDTGKVAPTSAKGQMLTMDAADGKFLYAAIQKPMKDVLVMRSTGGNSVRFSLNKANRFALMLKYAVNGDALDLVAANDNAAINGVDIAVSPDGTRIAMAGAGGWSPPSGSPRSYSIAVFDTSDMKSLAGQIDIGAYPRSVVFHPQLNLGAAGRYGSSAEVVFFNAKSLAKKESPIRLQQSGSMPVLLTFGAQGTKLIIVASALGGTFSRGYFRG